MASQIASQASFSVERLQRYASEAVRKIRRKWAVPHTVSLFCEYVGVATEGGRYDASLPTQASLKVGFEWRARAHNQGNAQVVSVRCDKLSSRGVPFPSWQIALQSLDMDEIVGKTVEGVATQNGARGVCCRFVGHPRRAKLSDEENTCCAVARINGVDHLLCAHIVDGQWLVHRGSIDDDGLYKKEPLHEQDMMRVDLSLSRLDQPPNKRCRQHLHAGQLREIIQETPRDFDRLIAVATYRAEALRAQMQGREIDEAAALCL